METQQEHIKQCENCNTKLQGEFCHNCGQQEIHNHGFLGSVIQDLLNTFFSYDSKVNRTVLPLLFRPGFLTREYMAGRRVRYILPFRLYLFSSVLCFILLSLWGDFLKVDAILAEQASKKEQTLADIASFENNSKLTPELDVMLDRLYQKTIPELINMTLESTPKVMLLLLPILALALKLLHWRLRIYFVDHLVMVFHCQSFLFLMLSLTMLLSKLTTTVHILPSFGMGLIQVITLLWTLFYIPIALKRVYQQSITLTAIKYLILLFTYFILATATLVAAFFWSLIWI